MFSQVHATQPWDTMTTSIQSALLSEDALTQYHGHKAQMWMSYAKNEQSENSLTIAGREATEYSQALINGLTDVQQISLMTPIVSVSQVMRRDLWWQIEFFKQNGAIHAEPRALAEAEVMLVWAAAEYCELGWRHAKEHFFAVEQRLYQVNQALLGLKVKIPNLETELPSLEQLNGQGCRGVNVNYWPLQVKTHATGNVPKQAEQEAVINIENVVHFALDQADLSQEGQRVLDRITDLLKQYSDIQITLVGHTDMRASHAYNLKLSQRRINRVRDYLVGHGVEVDRIAEQAKGKQYVLDDENQNIAHAKSRRVVIVFHDIEGKKVKVQPQWRDLQLEIVKQ